MHSRIYPQHLILLLAALVIAWFQGPSFIETRQHGLDCASPTDGMDLCVLQSPGPADSTGVLTLTENRP